MEINQICMAAVKVGASDIHIKVGKPPLVRINGEIRAIPRAPNVTQELASQMAWSMMNAHQRERFKIEADLDLAYEVPKVGRFRVNVFRQRGRVGLVLRTIPTQVKTVDELQLPTVLKKIALEPRGLVLMTGITGSGKSTTLAALVEEINRSLPVHIITIEDPVEFSFNDRRAIINQREVGADSKSFKSALRAALRQDPDVIFVGELRDLETMEIALSAAETGHLVMGTLHTLNATEAINRIIDFFEPHHQQQIRNQLSSVLKAVISQRLVPRVGGGRIPAVEVMLNTGSISECIVDGMRTKEIGDFIATGTAQYGTQTFDQSLYWHYKKGLISLEDALRFSNNADDLQLRLSGISGEDWVEPE
jgi:twitching motility protein PilT